MDDSILTVIKAKRASVKLGSQIEVDGYLMPDGEIRVGVSSASLSVGFGKSYLSEIEGKSPNQFKALQSNGFTGSRIPAEVDNARGSSRVETISLDDYMELIVFASEKGKKPAQALSRAMLRVSLSDFFRTAFAIPLMTMAEKKIEVDRIICSYYAQEQLEINNRRLPGDDLYLPMGIN